MFRMDEVMVGAAGRAWQAFVRNAPKPLEYERYFTIAGGPKNRTIDRADVHKSDLYFFQTGL